MDSRGQVAFEYLLTALFGIVLAIAAALVISIISDIAITWQAKLILFRQTTIDSLLS